MSEEPKKRKSAHEKIMELRKEFGIPEEETTEAEDKFYEAKRQAARKRADLAGTEENYVKMFNRDPWTDRWLGPGPEPPDEFLDYSDKDIKKMSKKITDETEWKKKYVPEVTTIHLPKEAKESKKVKKLRKKRQKAEDKQQKQVKYDIAYWYLESFLKRSEADKLYYEYAGKLDELVEVCYNAAIYWSTYMTHNTNKTISSKEMYERLRAKYEDEATTVEDVGGLKFKRIEVAERHRREYDVNPYTVKCPDIPDEYWKEFEDWCDKNPIKKFKKKAKKYPNMSAMGMRRICFLKQINKRNKGWRKNMMLHDPLTGASFVSEKKMKAALQKQLKKYDEKRKDFVKLLDGLVKDGQISEEMANGWMGDTKLVRDRVRKQWYAEYERAKVREKHAKKVHAHQKKTYEARKKWFEKNGGDITDKGFVIIDEEEGIRAKIINPGAKKPIYMCETGDGTTVYSERSLEDALFLNEPSEPRHISKPKFTKEYWDEYNELPDY